MPTFGCSPDEAKRNPGQWAYIKSAPDSIAFHPGYARFKPTACFHRSIHFAQVDELVVAFVHAEGGASGLAWINSRAIAAR